MNNRLIQLGDLHLAPGPRNADRLAALDFVIADAIGTGDKPPVAAWLWPGDLNDAGMSIEDRNALVERAIRMAQKAPVVIVPGNHDRQGDLDFLARLKTQWPIVVVTQPQVVTITLAQIAPRLSTVPQDQAAIFCLPYPSKAQLVASGTPHDQLHQVANDAFDLIFMQAGGELEKSRAAGILTLAIGHVNVSGAISSVGQPQIGKELEISEAHLARLGDCFKGFNHIHKHQQVGSAWYAGSLCRLDWGEIEPKGYLEITIGDWGHAVAFREVPVAPMYHVRGSLSRDAFIWVPTKGPDGVNVDPPMAQCVACAGSGASALKASQPASLLDAAEGERMESCRPCNGSGKVPNWTGCDVRVRAEYAQAERDVLGTARERVRAQFAQARRFEFEPVAVTAREVRAPEVVQAQTLDDKLRAWSRMSGVSWSDAIGLCAWKLQAAADPDELPGEVASRLEPLADLSQEAVAV